MSFQDKKDKGKKYRGSKKESTASKSRKSLTIETAIETVGLSHGLTLPPPPPPPASPSFPDSPAEKSPWWSRKPKSKVVPLSETSDQPPPGCARSSPTVTLESPATTAHTQTSLDELFDDDPQNRDEETKVQELERTIKNHEAVAASNLRKLVKLEQQLQAEREERKEYEEKVKAVATVQSQQEEKEEKKFQEELERTESLMTTQQRQTLANEREKLTKEIEKLSHDKQALSEHSKQMSRQVLVLRKQLETQQASITSPVVTGSQSEQLQQQVAQWRSEAENAKEDVIKLKANVETLTKERDEAREERVKRDSTYEQDHTELQKENQLLKKNVQEHQQKLDVEIREVETLQQHVQAKTVQVKQYKKQIDSLQEQKDTGYKQQQQRQQETQGNTQEIEDLQLELVKSRSKLEEREKHFSTLLQKNREMDIQLKVKTDEFKAKTEEKEHELQHLRRQYEVTVAQMKELQTQQEIVLKRAEMQAVQTQQQQVGMASELNRLQKREDEFSKAFRDEFEANKKLRAVCEALQKQLGSALDDLDGLRQQQDVLKQTLQDNGLLLPFLETEGIVQTGHGGIPVESTQLEKDELAKYNLVNVVSVKDDKTRGVGSYGSVRLVGVNGVPCIEKRLHDTGKGRNEPVRPRDRHSLQMRFRNECILLSRINHPNIVQFMGVTYGPSPLDLTLIMEHVHMDLGKCLECYKDILLPIKLSILLDVSYALLHLHSQRPAIIHRDLSAANVLVTPDMTAKVADLGMSRILDLESSVATAQKLTTNPGALAYMAPEAQKSTPRYGTKLDIFSFGAVALFVANQEFPQVYEESTVEAFEKQEIQIERRRIWLKKIEHRHCLYTLIIECLQDRPEKRPSTSDLMQHMRQLSLQYPRAFQDILQMHKEIENLQQCLSTANPSIEAERRTRSITEQIQHIRPIVDYSPDKPVYLNTDLPPTLPLDALPAQHPHLPHAAGYGPTTRPPQQAAGYSPVQQPPVPKPRRQGSQNTYY